MTSPELDVTTLVITYLSGLNVVAAGNVSARMPDQITPPFVLVQRVAGGDDWIVDHATIDVDTFADDFGTARDISRTLHHAMRQLHAKTVITIGNTPASIYRCTTSQTPIFMEWEPSGGGAVMTRFVARYVIDVRLPSITGY